MFLFAFGVRRPGRLWRGRVRARPGLAARIPSGGGHPGDRDGDRRDSHPRIPASFPLEGPHGEPGPGPLSIFTVGVWIQFAILAAVIAVGNWGRRSFQGDSRWRWAPALLMAILIVDLLNALPYDIKPDGIEIFAISEEETHPSVHALGRLRAAWNRRSRGRSRSAGRSSIEVLPGTFARAWRIPIAGGYGAMLVDRLSRLASMGTNGEVRPAPSSRTLTRPWICSP